MRALSVRHPYAELIARDEKHYEFRSWKTAHRGDLLIVASVAPCREGREEHPEIFAPGVTLAYGAAICVVTLVGIDGEPGDYEWEIDNARRVAPVKIRGKLNLYTVDDSLIRFV